MSDWKELVGGMLVAGTEGYMAGKQEEWSQEAARAKSQAARSLAKDEAKWAHQYEMKVEGFKQEGAERLEGLKQDGSTERQEIESSGKIEEARLDALGETKKATEAGVADQDPIDDKRSMDIITARAEQIEEQVRRDLQGDEPGVLADWLPGGNSSEKYETAVQAELQKRMGKDSVIKKHRNLLGEGETSSGSTTERPVSTTTTSGAPVKYSVAEVFNNKKTEVVDDGLISSLQIKPGETVQDYKKRTDNGEDSTKTNVIAPVVNKVLNMEIGLSDVLKGITNFFAPAAKAVGKIAGVPAEAVGKVADKTIRATGSESKELAHAVAKRLKYEYDNSTFKGLTQDEATQLRQFIKDMALAGAIDENGVAELDKMIQAGDIKSVANILSSI